MYKLLKQILKELQTIRGYLEPKIVKIEINGDIVENINSLDKSQ